MTLLSDFKNIIGVSGTTQDQFLIDYYIAPSIDIVNEYSTNYKIITVKQQSGTLEYDLTDSNVCTPAVSNVESVIHDGSIHYNLQYKKDYIIEDDVLRIINPYDVYTLDVRYKVSIGYSLPVITVGPPIGYTETDMPTKFFNAVIRYAGAIYNINQIQNGTTVTNKSEDNLSTGYGSIGDRMQVLEKTMKEAKKEIMRLSGKNLFDSIQVI